MPWFSYGYFVRLPDRSIVLSGHDFGPTPDSYAIGDSVGVRGDSQAFVIGILKGEPAKRSGGYDVFVLLEQRRIREKGEAPPPWDFFQRDEGKQFIEELMKPPARLVTRPRIEAVAGGKRYRAVGKKLHTRPMSESFHDFQVNHLLWLLGKDWYDTEMAKPAAERHIVLKWRAARNEQLRKHQDPGNPAAAVRAPLTGEIRALQVLADDLYQLQHAFDTPKQVIARLRDIRQFQGARYEILVASVFARCGFSIAFINDTSKRNPEFFAEKDGERIAVEAKSRHRAGVLNERGAFRENAPAEIRRLYENASGQNPGNCPFLILIDVNLPLTPDVPPLNKDWAVEAMRMFSDRHQEGLEEKDTGLFVTNFGWHFSREVADVSGECIFARVPAPKYRLREETWRILDRALSEYGTIPEEHGDR